MRVYRELGGLQIIIKGTLKDSISNSQPEEM
jgi:hypothetical protein